MTSSPHVLVDLLSKPPFGEQVPNGNLLLLDGFQLLSILNRVFLIVVPGYRVVRGPNDNQDESAAVVIARMVHSLGRLRYSAMGEVEQRLNDGDKDAMIHVLSWLLERCVGPPTLWETDATLHRIDPSVTTMRDFVANATTFQYYVYPPLEIERTTATNRLTNAFDMNHRTVSLQPQIKSMREKLAEWMIANYPSLSPLVKALTLHKDTVVPLVDRNPPGSAVQSFAFHPHADKCAIGLSDDSVKIYQVGQKAWETVSLSHEFQVNLHCMQWAPLSGTRLAIGCRNGICVWDGVSSESPQMTYLAGNNMTVTALCWSPNGRYLACGSSVSTTSAVVWDVATRTPVSLGNLGTPVSRLQWSQSGAYLFVGSTSKRFGVWETKTWNFELWSDSDCTCEAASWSPDGKTLLIATEIDVESEDQEHAEKVRQNTVYSLLYNDHPPRLDGVVSPVVLNLQEAVEACSLGTQTFARVRDMIWDATGERLAVCFQDLPGIAVYSVKQYPVLEFFLRGVVWGPTGALPYRMEFCNNFKQGSLLMVAYHLDGQDFSTIRFVPMYYHKLEDGAWSR